VDGSGAPTKEPVFMGVTSCRRITITATVARPEPGVTEGGADGRNPLGVVPIHVVDSTRAHVLRLGCLAPSEVRALACLILDRG
jgi:hypothetical protein